MRKRRRYFFEAQSAALGDVERARQDLRRVLEHAIHLVVALDEELRALKLHPRGIVNRLARLNAQHHILRMRIVLAKIVAVVGRHQRQPEILLQLEKSRMDLVLHRQALILNLEIKIVLAENVDKSSGSRARSIVLPFHQPLRDFTFQASRKPDQSARMLRQKLLAHSRLVIKAVQRSFRRNLHQIAVALFVLGQHQQMVVGVAVGRRALDVVIILLADIKFAAHDRLHASVIRRIHKMHGAKNISVVGHGHGGHA